MCIIYVSINVYILVKANGSPNAGSWLMVKANGSRCVFLKPFWSLSGPLHFKYIYQHTYLEIFANRHVDVISVFTRFSISATLLKLTADSFTAHSYSLLVFLHGQGILTKRYRARAGMLQHASNGCGRAHNLRNAEYRSKQVSLVRNMSFLSIIFFPRRAFH